MGGLADRLDRMLVRVTSPDRSVTAELHGRTDVRLTFAPGVYDRSYQQDLEAQLETVAKLLWAARMKAYYAALSEVLELTITGETKPISPRDVDYYAARNELLAEGQSRDGHCHLSVHGMRHWTVRIASGTLDVLSEPEFGQAISEAADQLIRDQQTKIRELKQEFYG